MQNVHSVEEFQGAIPLQHYETLYPWIERSLRGEKDVLVRGKIDRFATSSGTTGKNKYIPVTKASLKKNHYRA
ncbi:GH3 auxin-responsive promoter family protein [Patescibacteria group bacterium]|nr:GH3 auxin-responsive promoter family protein [Patescibacteria group bacterium]